LCRFLAKQRQSLGVIIPAPDGITSAKGGSPMKKERKQATSSAQTLITFDTVREIARELPGALESTSYGTPAFKVGKCLFARQHDERDLLVIKIDPAQRSMRMMVDPETFFITDHYLNYPYMLVRLSKVVRDDLRELLEDAWQMCAPKRMRSSGESEQGTSQRRRRR
jgi:hypothetical protein